jgi:glycosyltransferase involved in cell wall biosynthesis
MDDATPGTENEKIARSFKDKVPGLIYEKHPQNRGYERTYLHCLEKARGEFFILLADDDEIPPPYIEACVDTLQAHPEALFSSVYIRSLFAPHPSRPEDTTITFPAVYMENSWFRRVFTYAVLDYFRDNWEGRQTMYYAVHRTAPFLDAVKTSMERFFHNKDSFHDSIFFFEMLLRGKVIPVIKEEATYTWVGYTQKEYGDRSESPHFWTNQINKIKLMRDYIIAHTNYVLRVYEVGGWRYALPFSVGIMAVLSHMFCSALYTQVKLRLKKICR